MSIQNVFIPRSFHEWQWTRYLYIKHHVFYSLTHSMIQSNIPESLFWAYELYYSGFQDELFVFLNKFYNKKDSRMTAFWEKKQTEYKTNECILATLIVNCLKPGVSNKSKKKIYIIYQEKDIQMYKTAEASDEIRAYRILHHKCVYPSIKTLDEIYKSYDCLQPYSQTMTEMDLKYLLYLCRTQSQWLYYCSNTPIWRTRIEEYGGIVNTNTYQIEFKNEENEDEFFEFYGYEPDEQPFIVIKNTILKE